MIERATRSDLRIAIPAEHHHVPALVAWLDRELAPHCPQWRYFQVRAAIVEAVNNVVSHGLDGGAPDQQIELGLRIAGRSVAIDLEDRGRPIPSDKLDSARLPDFDPDHIDHLPESGFGLGIIAAAVDRLTYRSGSGRNCLTLTVALEDAP
ncbi:ATP-binding protein [Pelagibacterium limicola]|uniref:ATP-binding protein n=1 Tax=Pelagibacterium limicola TaxID=2791022 RepID=UPI0018AF73A3